METNSFATAPPAPRWGFGATIGWGMALATVYVVLQVMTVGVFATSRGADTSAEEIERLIYSLLDDGLVLSTALLVTSVVCGVLLVGIVKLKKGAVLTDYLALRPVAPRAVFPWIAGAIGLMIASDLIATLLGRPTVQGFMTSAYTSAAPIWLLWVAVVIAAPLFEEVSFRGFLISGFEARLGSVGAVLLASLLWMMVHIQYGPYELSVIFVLGCLLGAARVQTKSILVPSCIHILVNFGATVQTAFYVSRGVA